MSRLANSLLAVLPQTQCTRCGYCDCAAYAQAMAAGTTAINQCPPGGAQGVALLAALTGQAALVLNPLHGHEAPRSVAWIDEDWCIGCTLCIAACPVDAIVGSNKLMHTVIETYCTGCELCLPVCPVDCIGLENISGNATGWSAWSQPQADLARGRYGFKNYRRLQDIGEDANHCEAKTPAPLIANKKHLMLATVLQRARAQSDASKNAGTQ